MHRGRMGIGLIVCLAGMAGLAQAQPEANGFFPPPPPGPLCCVCRP